MSTGKRKASRCSWSCILVTIGGFMFPKGHAAPAAALSCHRLAVACVAGFLAGVGAAAGDADAAGEAAGAGDPAGDAAGEAGGAATGEAAGELSGAAGELRALLSSQPPVRLRAMELEWRWGLPPSAFWSSVLRWRVP